MEIESKTKRNFIVSILFSFIPEVTICAIAVALTDSDWPTFFVFYFGLKAIQLIVWTANSVFSWATFFINGRKAMAAAFVDFMMENEFPIPGQSERSPEGYFKSLAEVEEVPNKVRFSAYASVNEIHTYRRLGHIQDLMRLNMALEDALVNYRRQSLQTARRSEGVA